MGDRAFGSMPQLAQMLAPHFTVITYDRRGRGESSNSKPYAVEREVEDIDALVQATGGSASLYGISSGACLAFEAALRLGGKISKLAMYEPPYNVDPPDRPHWQNYRKQLAEAIAAGLRGEAAPLFTRFLAVPAAHNDGMRRAPLLPSFSAL